MNKNLSVSNRENFKELYFQLCLKKLRRKINLYLLSEDKTGFNLFQMDDRNHELYKDRKIKKELLDAIREELQQLGWKTKLLYGDTSLFIYDKEEEIPKDYGELIE